MVATAERPAPEVRRPLSKKASVGLTLSILALLFVFYLLHKVDWTEPPVYSGAVIYSSTQDFGNNIKQSVLVSSDSLKKVELNYNDTLREKGWYNESGDLNHPNFILDDESKNLTFIDYHFFHVECPAFYLSVAYEELPDTLTKITISEFVGPCGSKFK